MDRGAPGLNLHRVPAGLRAGAQPGGIPVGPLEAARAAQRLPAELLGVGRSGAPRVETHPAASTHHGGVLAAILLGAWLNYIMRISIISFTPNLPILYRGTLI